MLHDYTNKIDLLTDRRMNFFNFFLYKTPKSYARLCQFLPDSVRQSNMFSIHWKLTIRTLTKVVFFCRFVVKNACIYMFFTQTCSLYTFLPLETFILNNFETIRCSTSVIMIYSFYIV